MRGFLVKSNGNDANLMPVFDFTNNYLHDARTVLVVMHCPTDEERRKRLYAQIVVDGMPDSEDIPSSIAKHLLSPPAMVDNSDICMWEGGCAGKILEFIATMDMNGIRASKRKALILLETLLFGKRTIEGKAVKYSNKVLERHWYKFRNVSHLWAAWNSYIGFPKGWTPYLEESKPIDDAFNCFSEENFPEFLARSEWFRKFGENHYPQNQKNGPTLNSKEVWRVPEIYDIPQLEPSLEMSHWMVSTLNNYRARS
jgi:hypothetical protein